MISYGWCAPSTALLDILAGNVDPGPECVTHQWIRRRLSRPECCSACAGHDDWILECEECCECWTSDGPDHTDWKAVWDSLEDT